MGPVTFTLAFEAARVLVEDCVEVGLHSGLADGEGIDGLLACLLPCLTAGAFKLGLGHEAADAAMLVNRWLGTIDTLDAALGTPTVGLCFPTLGAVAVALALLLVIIIFIIIIMVMVMVIIIIIIGGGGG
jgi:hypothetical protein